MSTSTATASATSAQAHLQQLRAEMKGAFVGRDAEIDALLLGLLARTHVLLLGPPGTAKSLVTQVFAHALGGAYFQRLLTAFSAPEEVFGPYDLSALDAGKYERAVQGYLPTAHTAFLDEVFKANSAVLNALLTMLNEREFDNGTSRVSCPLQLCVAASNEYPADSSLEALYDRFQVRCWTEYVATRAERLALLTCPDPASRVTATLSAEVVAQLQQQARDVVVPPVVLEALLDVADALAKKHGLVISDRRLRALVKLVQARAALHGRSTAAKRDLVVLADSVWHRHDQRPAVLATVLELAAPSLAKAQALADAAREVHDGIKDFRTETELAKKLQRVQQIEDEIVALGAEDAEDADVLALAQEVAGMRKAIARGFATASGLLRALGR